MRARTVGMLAIATVLVTIGCQRPRAVEGGGGGYNPRNQPAVNQLGTPGPVLEGGRIPRSAGGPNAGSYGTPPSEGYRGSGSAYYPPAPPIMERQKAKASPSP